MRILHTSDWHVGKTLHEHSLLEDQRYFLDQLLAMIQKDPHDVMIVAGDIYDRSVPPAEAVNLLDDFLGRLRSVSEMPVLIIPGNHDSAMRLGYLADLVRSQNIFFLSDIQRIHEPVTIQGVDFYGIPFLSPYDMDLADLEEGNRVERNHENAVRAALQRIQPVLDRTRINVLIAHLFATGGTTSDSERTFVGTSGEVNVSLFSDFDYVALGHLHRPQKAGENAHYSGSPLAYSFSEAADQKCLLSVTLPRSEKAHKARTKSEEGSPKDAKKNTGSKNGKTGKSREGHEEAATGPAEMDSLALDSSPAHRKAPGIREVPIQPMRKVSRIQGTLEELLKSREFESFCDDYLEIELLDHAYAGSPMKELSRRFNFLLSIRRRRSSGTDADSMPARAGKTMEDDFQAFQDFIYAGIENPLKGKKEKIFLEEKRAIEEASR